MPDAAATCAFLHMHTVCFFPFPPHNVLTVRPYSMTWLADPLMVSVSFDLLFISILSFLGTIAFLILVDVAFGRCESKRESRNRLTRTLYWSKYNP